MSYSPPQLAIGDTRINVNEDFPNAPTDTDAINAAFSALGPGGGEVHITTPRDYTIDVTKMILPVNNSRLRLEEGVRLRPSPSRLDRAFLLYINGINNFELVGGELVGDRDSFVIAAGDTGTYEHRHAIACFGSSNINIRNTSLTRWVGDGISIGGSTTRQSRNIVLYSVLSSGNRRQGCSITSVDGMYVSQCEFSNTLGTSPECGIDIEPEATQSCNNITIEDTLFAGNHMYGLQALRRAGCGPVTNLVFRRNTVRNNSNGIVLDNVAYAVIEGGMVDHNRATGILIRPGTSNVSIGKPAGGNDAQMVSFQNNYTSLARRLRNDSVVTGLIASMDRDVLIKPASKTLPAPSNIKVLTNHLLQQTATS